LFKIPGIQSLQRSVTSQIIMFRRFFNNHDSPAIRNLCD